MAHPTEGYEIENRMKKFFKGQPIRYDEVDFQTTKCLYEVKSAQLFNLSVNNGNQNRKSAGGMPHKQCSSYQLGRFHIKTDNHIALFLRSIQLNKIPKYIFVVRFGKQIMFRIMPWKQIKLNNDKNWAVIKLKEIFANIEQKL